VLTTRFTHRTRIVAVLACALLAIAAPADAAPPPDMHASFAEAAAKAQQKQDLRSPDARDATMSARQQDLNRLRAGGYTPGSTPAVSGQAVNAPGATAVDSVSQRPQPSPPTWPVNPEPIKPAPVVHASDTGSGLDWTTIALGFAGGLLVLGGIAGVVLHGRRVGRGQVAA
jgi:hypothetical protein